MTPKNELADDMEVLRRFGLAMVRDNSVVCDGRSAEILVEKLARQSALAVRNGEDAALGARRLRLFSLFIRHYRRHVRMAALEDGVSEAPLQGHPQAADIRENASPLEGAI